MPINHKTEFEIELARLIDWAGIDADLKIPSYILAKKLVEYLALLSKEKRKSND